MLLGGLLQVRKNAGTWNLTDRGCLVFVLYTEPEKMVSESLECMCGSGIE